MAIGVLRRKHASETGLTIYCHSKEALVETRSLQGQDPHSEMSNRNRIVGVQMIMFFSLIALIDLCFYYNCYLRRYKLHTSRTILINPKSISY